MTQALTVVEAPSADTLAAFDTLPPITGRQTYGAHVFAVLNADHYVLVGPELDAYPEWLGFLLDGEETDWSAETHDDGVTAIVHITRQK